MATQIDYNAFYSRIQATYKSWKNEKEAGDVSKCDALVACNGADQDVIYSKSTATQTWLLGYEFTDTVMVCCKDTVYFLASKKKIDILEGIHKKKDKEGPSVKLLTRDKTDKDSANFKKLTTAIKDSGNGKSVGVYAKDKFSSEFVDAWKKAIADFAKVDMSTWMGSLMSKKDEKEIKVVYKASTATVDVYNKYLKEQLMDIIDKDKKIKHKKFAEGVEKAMTDKKYVSVDPQQCEPCYPPIVQSGAGNYALKFSVNSDKNDMHFSVIVVCMGVRYRNYCSNICRTFLVNPSDAVQKNYEFLLTLFTKLTEKLKSGRRLLSVYQEVVDFCKSERKDLVEHLTKNFGFGTGIEFRESGLVIGPKTEARTHAGQVYNTSIGLQDLVNKEAADDAGKKYSLFIGDTVVVEEDKPAMVCTNGAKKKLKSMAMFLQDDDEEDGEEEEAGEELEELMGRGARRATAIVDSKLRTEASSEDKRKVHQKKLAVELNEAARERLASQKGKSGDTKVRKSVVSYKSASSIPDETMVINQRLYVDRKYETVILPISGMPVPFHISCIKNVSQANEGDYTYLRINFFHPGAALGKADIVFPNPEAVFLKEITYRNSNKKVSGEVASPASNLNAVFTQIKDVQKNFKMREAEEKEKENLVKQDSLVVSSGKSNPKLKDLSIRPNIVQKRLNGTLEAHSNGFRYTSIRGDKVDILYNNIKTAFFQPCDGEMIILLHFHLKHAIMFGKKKHLDVQFYTEVGEITTDLGKSQHMHDRDDLGAEQAERELRHKLKAAFTSFTTKVSKLTEGKIEFDSPFRELGFAGAPFRSTVQLLPTSTCLINLVEWPPYVVVLNEVECVHFERVQFHLKNFDIVFIFKDYTKKTSMINAVPMNMLDHVKQWLDSCEIRYTEGVQSLNWPKVMKTIVDDPDSFFEQGGWSFLDPQSDDEAGGDEDSEDEDEDFRPDETAGSDDGGASDGSEDESDSEDYSSEDSDASEDGSDASADGSGSDEESGMDWSDLEREAAEDDRNRGKDDDGGGDRDKKSKHRTPEKKHKSSHKSSSSHKSPHKSSSHKSSKSPHKNSHKSPHKSSGKRSRDDSRDDRDKKKSRR